MIERFPEMSWDCEFEGDNPAEEGVAVVRLNLVFLIWELSSHGR